ncbi:MAG TPA: hypothetical protein VIJ92_13095, partial [Ginsengibacter sp.]
MQLPKNIIVLIEKYFAGTITPEEKFRLDEWYHSFNDSEIELTENGNETEQGLADRIKSRVLETIDEEYAPVISRPRRTWQLSAAAAFILI